MQDREQAVRLIGDHPLVRQVSDLARRVSASDVTVLLLGESGTGKEVLARSIHANGPRRERPFVAVNCGAIPTELLESEMFGHERGAFTGATIARSGLFAQAHGGTIFLDEIAEMSPALQVKLLRVLQDKEVRPVGADRSQRVDMRVIAATNKDLGEQVRRGLFREDLFYRLQVIPIALPPLRERRSDVPKLVEHFLARHNAGRARPLVIAEEALVHLWEYDWPGNVRELENVIERLAVLCDGGRIGVDDLPSNVRAFLSEKRLPRPVLGADGIDLNRAVEEFEGRLIAEALERTRGNKQAAARLLGLKRTTLVAKLRKVRIGGEDDAETGRDGAARAAAGGRARA
ncbi:MAG: sigma-54 interaction domain-containing protein [Alphaproteobacteria bacterium]